MFKKIVPNTTLFLTIVFALGLIGFFSVAYQRDKMIADNVIIDTAYQIAPKEVPTHIDSLPYYQYKIVRDSIDKVEEMNKSRNTLSPDYRIGAGFLGLMQTSSYYYDYYGNGQSHLNPNYFMAIPNYALTPPYRYAYQDGKNYLVKKRNDSTAIDVAYLTRTQTVLIPIEKSSYDVMRKVFGAIMIIAIGVAIYIYIVLPIIVLINISSGNVFTRGNIRKLKILAYTTLGCVLLQLLMPYLVGLIFIKKIPDAFVISFSDVFTNQLNLLLFGTILLAIASAFAKGYKLQQDQDLTI